MLWFRCVFFALSRAALWLLKKEEQQLAPRPPAPRGWMLTHGGRGMRDPGHLRPGARPFSAAPQAARAVLGRPTRVGPGTGIGFVPPAQQSLSVGRTRMSPS